MLRKCGIAQHVEYVIRTPSGYVQVAHRVHDEVMFRLVESSADATRYTKRCAEVFCKGGDFVAVPVDVAPEALSDFIADKQQAAAWEATLGYLDHSLHAPYTILTRPETSD